MSNKKIPKTRRLSKLSTEAFALLDYLFEQLIATGEEQAYRLKIPYNSIDPTSKSDGSIIIELDIYYDQHMEVMDEEGKQVFKITGPHKERH